MSAKKTPAQPNTTPRQPQPEEKARKEPVVFRAGRGEKAAVVCGNASCVYDGPITITVQGE